MSARIALIGDSALTLEAARQAREAGFQLAVVASRHAGTRDYAEAHAVPLHDPDRLDTLPEGIDWLLSAGNVALLPESILRRFKAGAINFHDGPLPERPGRNAPAWALIEGARSHAITWHLMTTGVDAGDILLRQGIEIAPDETAQSLNARCFAAAVETLPALFAQMRHGLRPRPQAGTPGRLHRAADRPVADGLIDGRGPIDRAERLVRGLDHGDHPNPLCRAKIAIASGLLLIGGARVLETGPPSQPPGTIRAVRDGALELLFEDGVLALTGLRRLDGGVPTLPEADDRLPAISDPDGLTARMARIARHEPHWRAALEALKPVPLAGLRMQGRTKPDGPEEILETPDLPGTPTLRAAAWALLAARLDGAAQALVLPSNDPHLSDWLPLDATPRPEETLVELAARLQAQAEAARDMGGFAADLPTRLGGPVTPPTFALGAGLRGGAVLGFDPEGGLLRARAGALLPGVLDLLAARLAALLAADPQALCDDLPALSEAERALVLTDWNATEGPVPGGTLHAAVAAQAARTPDAVAVISGEMRLTHAELEARANRMAHVLRDMGAGPGARVGLHLRRSAEMVVAALAVLKSGAAYLPLDPGYPEERLALYLEDSAAALVITEAAIADKLPPGEARQLRLDDPRIAAASDTPPEESATAEDLAYLIYTSGSTGRPKGVMIEHRQAMNFLAGMDERVPQTPGDMMLAVTSISFDISVLELFWSLSRGLGVVVQGEAERLLTAAEAPPAKADGPAISLFYWGHEDSDTGDYALLLDGARFADAHGFEAVWTPERHFHGFGAAYPNPAVTGAAVAAATTRIAVRAGSCLAPLHHPARIAEDWAVVDRLSGGRAGIALAAGWQPDDFVLRPEAAPPAHRAALHDAADAVRRLWRGEAVAFPAPGGGMREVATRPRPVSAELPLWITVAGNPESWREAGRIGANVLTHLLGQSLEELETRIGEWREALRRAGHDPATRRVTVMLHAYLDESRSAARAAVRAPMLEYLRSATGLIARHAAAFPAFRANGGAAPEALSPEEEAAVLDHAFERYFDAHGLFGTVDDAREKLARLGALGVDEVACLIDFGLAPERVMAALPRLAELVPQAAEPGDAMPDPDDLSIAAQIRRHGISHLQCTPSMARMLCADPGSRAALGRLRHMLVGGEALPATLAEDLRAAGVPNLLNMYGPTETTVWSTSATVSPELPAAVIGTPILNTVTYVLDADMQPCPVGDEGELWIGGAGVARGYWQRPELTAERFQPDPFRPGERIYRTGDLARWRADGRLEFGGRADGQIKLRGHRIELGEVEAVLDSLSGRGPCVAMLREDSPGDARLVAYVESPEPVDEAGLRAAMAARLPAIMVPARIVALERFPLTPNRKTDRKAMPPPLPQKGHRAAEDTVSVRAPVAPIRQPRPGGALDAVAAIWRELLDVERVTAEDSFFDLGGHSLLAVQAHREIRDRLGVPELRVTDIFGLPRLGDLAARIEAALVPAAAPEQALTDQAAARAEMMARRRALRARRCGDA
ncbi:MupA/Atu3671 family FMN-dependent luciferase-like monooxygenase [Limimaricola variabilis]